MSWSNQWIGRPSAIARELQNYSGELQGQGRSEYDTVKDALISLVLANSDQEAILLDANGHAHENPTSGRYASCQVSLKKLGKLIE